MKTLIFTLIISVLCKYLFAQNPGDLNIDFNEDGYYLEDWADTITNAYDIGIMPDGNMVVPGYISTASELFDVFVSKFDEYGVLLPFGNLTRGFGYDLADFDQATSVAVLPDNSIFIAGAYSHILPEFRFFIIKTDSNGEPDAAFDSDGLLIAESTPMIINKITTYHHGDTYSVIVCGDNTSETSQILMLTAEGTRETSFGTNGIVTMDEHPGTFTDMFIDEVNDLLYACGSITLGGIFVCKYNLPDGSPVNGFGTNGELIYTPELGYNGSCNALTVDTEENTITLFGSYLTEIIGYDIYAYRIMADDGSDDDSFGIDGISVLSVPGSDESLRSAVLQADGKYYFGGHTDYYGTEDFLLGRMNHDGYADMTFGTNGLVVTDMGFDERIRRIMLNGSENMLYAAGTSVDGDNNAQTIAAYHTGYEFIPPVDANENSDIAFSYYPNPTSGIVSLETGLAGTQQVQIFDLAGKEFLNKSFSNGSIELNLECLQPTAYFIRVRLPDGTTSTGKLILH